ncbi:alanine dehydrogenase [Corallococcus sp. H22C18031201]|uniref:alanine dehydrogenase n=1 Tax=Citreicoccus inhibens TaxID=2849499 RepID=UPI000E72EE58|nr:alanine dehydrogenase [Citreicoccus inhibens]MBU8894472.1 alanine dehydrogenase [Citreicoccus inhibens]RJS25075.1 alanine dehydrogenase [Corallococcus sp. H22C18031201]
MIVGVPKEIKTREYRVGMVPAGVRALTSAGHTVLVETNAGAGSGIPDSEYQRVGAKIINTADEVWKSAEMIVKVKEPIAPEYERIQPGQIIYTYFHLAGVDPELTKTLVKKKAAAVAYETLQLDDGSLPLLKPMSEVAGKMAIQVGAACLEKAHGGKGILLGGVPGVRRGRVAVIGGGVVGLCAAKVAVGMGAEVTILDVNLERLTYLDDVFLGRAQTLASDSESVARSVREADLVIGGVLIPGGKAPKLVSKELIAEMEPGSVVVDVAVDQGGCIETCKPTTHDNPTFMVSDVVHYCVANMPGAVPQTSTFALTNTTRPYARKIADMGLVAAVKADPALARAMNTYNGHVTYEAVAKDLGYEYVTIADAFAGRK